MLFLTIAWNNLLRNRRRTISTVLAIIFGVSMIIFVNGFNDGLSRGWASDIINAINGHFILRHQDYNKHASTDLEKILMEDPDMLRNELMKNPHIVETMASVGIGGLVGQEEKSTTFFGSASDTSVLYKVLPETMSKMAEGEKLSYDDPMGAVLGKALADSINVKVGDELVILSGSIYSEQTAIIVTVKGTINIPGAEEVEQNLLLTDIRQVQEDLLDIGSGASELVVRIDKDENLEPVLTWVNQHFKERGEPWVAVPWYENKEFQQVTGLFNGIGLVVSIVLYLVVGIVISNALLMSVFERIKEIGTIRAIGSEKSQVYKIFYYEALITTAIGTGLGLIMGSILIWITGRIGIPMVGAGEDVVIYPMHQLSNYIISFLVPFVVIMIAIRYPIKSSCKMTIVDSLNYV